MQFHFSRLSGRNGSWYAESVRGSVHDKEVKPIHGGTSAIGVVVRRGSRSRWPRLRDGRRLTRTAAAIQRRRARRRAGGHRRWPGSGDALERRRRADSRCASLDSRSSSNKNTSRCFSSSASTSKAWGRRRGDPRRRAPWGFRRKPGGNSARRVHRAGPPQRVRDLSPQGRARRQAAGSLGRPGLAHQTRESLQRAAARSRSIRPRAARSRSRSTRRSRRCRIRRTRSTVKYVRIESKLLERVLGPQDGARRLRARCRRDSTSIRMRTIR